MWASVVYHVRMSHQAGENPQPPDRDRKDVFDSEVVDRVRASGNVWRLDGGELRLPRVFGFCRGVRRALNMLSDAVERHVATGKKLVLLGEIIHNPWVNDYVRERGVKILCGDERERLEEFINNSDCGVIPAFGVPLEIERRLLAIGCEIVDTSCGDVRRLWVWANRAAADGYGIMIFGRAMHDETVVTKSRLTAAGGSYLVVGNLAEARLFCDMLCGREPEGKFHEAFSSEATNAETIEPLKRLAQVSQTTMLYDDTMRLREILRKAFDEKFASEAGERLAFQPTVCRATQSRQASAVELCRSGCDVVIVIGGFGSSNTRHLYELAREYCPAYFIENAEAIRSRSQLLAFDPQEAQPAIMSAWLTDKKPIRIGVLAGASTPEVVVGEVLTRLAEFVA